MIPLLCAIPSSAFNCQGLELSRQLGLSFHLSRLLELANALTRFFFVPVYHDKAAAGIFREKHPRARCHPGKKNIWRLLELP